MSGAATQEDAAEWAQTHGLTFPVLADPSNTGWNYIQTGMAPGQGSYGLPNTQLLSPGMKVEQVNGGVSHSAAEAFLESE